jgi:hypothetical protein
MQQLRNIPYAVTDPDHEGLNYLAVEISYGSEWVNLNDQERFRIGAQNTRDNTQKRWRKVTATSPVLGGDYLVHAVPEMITEQVSVWVLGNSQTDLADNFFFLEELFEQFDFRIRWTFNEYREYWRCQLADSSSSRGQVWTHSQMALNTYSVPRYPNVERERIG